MKNELALTVKEKHKLIIFTRPNVIFVLFPYETKRNRPRISKLIENIKFFKNVFKKTRTLGM